LEPGEVSSRAQWNEAPKRERSGAKPDPLTTKPQKIEAIFCGFVVRGERPNKKENIKAC